MSSLNDLPSLGGKRPAPPIEEDSNGFDDFDFGNDHIGDSSNKLSDAEKRLQDFYKEENEGFRVQVPTTKNEKPKNRSPPRSGFKVSIDGVDNKDEDEEIEEEIQTDRDDYIQAMKNIGQGLTESGNNYGTSGITVSQSLGVDPSVDSLALDDYDHIEHVIN